MDDGGPHIYRYCNFLLDASTPTSRTTEACSRLAAIFIDYLDKRLCLDVYILLRGKQLFRLHGTQK